MYITLRYLLLSINSVFRALIHMAAIVAPMEVKFQEVIGMGVFRASKGTISDGWTFSVIPAEG